jgi:hypothetical protein
MSKDHKDEKAVSEKETAKEDKKADHKDGLTLAGPEPEKIEDTQEASKDEPKQEEKEERPATKRIFVPSNGKFQVHNGTKEDGYPNKYVEVFPNGHKKVVECDKWLEVPMIIANLLGQGEDATQPVSAEPDVFKADVYS